MKLSRMRAFGSTRVVGIVLLILVMVAPSHSIERHQSRDLAAPRSSAERQSPIEASNSRPTTTTTIQQHNQMGQGSRDLANDNEDSATRRTTTTSKSSLLAEETTSENHIQYPYYQPKLRGTRRRLPGDYGGFDIDFQSAEAGFGVGVLLFVVLVLLLCCCCCGGGRRGGGGCGLWDIVACLCIWEMCCDRDGAAFNDFTAF